MNRQTYMEVSKSNFKYNIEQIKKYVPGKEVMPVIKANGYGTYINCRISDYAHYMYPNGAQDSSAYFYIVEGRGCSPCSRSRYYGDCGCYG